MLGNEDGVAAIGRLLAVLERRGGREALDDQVIRVGADRLATAQLDERCIPPAQVEPRAKTLAGERVQSGVDRVPAHTPRVADGRTAIGPPLERFFPA